MAGLTAVSAEELAALEIFKGCRPDALESLAGQLRPLNATAGRVLMRQGERAESFLLINSGKAQVTHTDSEGVPTVLELSSPMIIGEIALLRDVPRTATVRAATDADLFALDRDDFLPAVTGHAGSSDAADAVIGSRLGISTV